MYGYWYSVKEHYSFSKDELSEVFWTSLAFAFMVTSHFKDLFVITNDIRIVVTGEVLSFFVLALIVTFLGIYAHVSLQKLVAIKLGYTAKYSYWLNGILLGLFFSVMTLGKVPILSLFILPGSVTLEHSSQLRLGRFRYGINAKDIARVSIAGPLAHMILVMILGVLFFMTDKNPTIFILIKANLWLMIYSMIPIPKLDVPSKMDGASDGFGVFFFSRNIYLFCAFVVLFYALMIWIATLFSFVIALGMGAISMWVYFTVNEQKN